MLKLAPKPQKKKKKVVAFERIDPHGPVGVHLYALLERLVNAHHPHLQNASIALVWCGSWKPDVDGRMTLGRCRKVSDRDKEFARYDFIIEINRAWWRHPSTTDAQREAILDHELCHAQPKYDDAGEQLVDERERLVWRTRKHDIEEFVAVVERHAIYKSDIEAFARALFKSGYPAWEACGGCENGWLYVRVDGRPVARRCSCWTEYQERRAEVLAS